jgi:hypothetical protein
MTRWSVALGVGAALVLFASAGTAAAAAPEYLACYKQKKGEYSDTSCTTKSRKAHKGAYELKPISRCVPQKKGNYTDPGCTTVSNKPHKGSYEIPPEVRFTSTGAGSTLGEAIGSPAPVATCASYSDSGRLTGPKTAEVTETFSGCSAGGHVCGPSGIVQSWGALETSLVGPGEAGPGGHEPASGEVWTEVTGAGGVGNLSYDFSCQSLPGPVEVRGASSALTTGDINVASTSSLLEYSPTRGEPDLSTVINGLGGPYATRFELSAKTTFSTGVVIKD